MTVSKQDLVKQVSEIAGLSKKDSANILDATIESITDTLAKGGKVQLVGFGTFETRERAARKGRNPQTGEEIDIAATTIPAFKPGKELKDAVK